MPQLNYIYFYNLILWFLITYIFLYIIFKTNLILKIMDHSNIFKHLNK